MSTNLADNCFTMKQRTHFFLFGAVASNRFCVNSSFLLVHPHIRVKQVYTYMKDGIALVNGWQ